MNKRKMDEFIKEKLKLDYKISNKLEKSIKKFKEEIVMEEKNESKKVIKISLNKFLAIAACLVIVGFLGINVYSVSRGNRNVFSTIQALVKKENTENIKEENSYNLKIFVGNKSKPTIGLNNAKVTLITGIEGGDPKEIYTDSKGIADFKINKEIQKADIGYLIKIEYLNNSSELSINIKYEDYEPIKVTTENKEKENGGIKYIGVTEQKDVELYWYFYDEEENENENTIIVNNINNETTSTNIVNNSSNTNNISDTSNISDTNNISDTSSILKTLYGDANCDGKVDLKDSAYIERYLANWEGYKLTKQGKINADVNRDEKVEQFDANIIKEYLAGNYKSLPVKLTNTEWILKNLPGMNIEYPSNWVTTEINKNNWNFQQGEPSCIFEGFIGETKVTVTIYEPEYKNIYNYEDLLNQEANENGVSYNENKISGYNIYSQDSEHLKWVNLLLLSSTNGITNMNYYNLNSIGWVNKINITYDNQNQDEVLEMWRVLDEMIGSIRSRSY